ncbi:MAG: hypothetical protein E6J55_04740 [Deltaproteobacteria bacterium]|nr:MAG: hypothetical protein E6J55_04740 [Deltaproteobacteria bacterium]
MSSILDALEKVENAERWTPQAGPARPEGRSKLRLAAIAAGVAFAAGAGVAALVLRPGPQRTAAPELARVPSAAPAAEPARVAQIPAAPVPSASAPTNAPSTPVAAEAAPPAAAVAAASTPVAAVAPTPPPPGTAAAPSAPAPEAPRPPVEGAAANPAAPTQAPRQPAVAAVEPRREPIDEGRSAPRLPTVRLSFLVYSPSAERRSVVLATEGGSLTTLHEGERVGDIEVARILPDSVELRYEGRVFTVSPRD